MGEKGRGTGPAASARRERRSGAAERAGVPSVATLSRPKLLDELFQHHVESRIDAPTFVVDYPVELSPLAKIDSSSSAVTTAFGALLGPVLLTTTVYVVAVPGTSVATPFVFVIWRSAVGLLGFVASRRIQRHVLTASPAASG